MSVYKIKGETMSGIADAIRSKTGNSDSYTLEAMATAIREIGKEPPELGIAYGDTAPEDTGKLWIRTGEPAQVQIRSRQDTEMVEAGKVALPQAAHSIAAAAVGGKVYLFGGLSAENNGLSTIHVFDPETDTITRLPVVLPSTAYGSAAAAVGEKVYLFGGRVGSGVTRLNTINMFDTQTNTITTLSTALSSKVYYIAAAAVGTKIYLFGGSYTASGSGLYSIDVFDTETNAISRLNTYLPTAAFSIAAATVGEKVYLFGGNNNGNRLSTIQVFDAQTETLSMLSVALPTAAELLDPLYRSGLGLLQALQIKTQICHTESRKARLSLSKEITGAPQ